MCQYKSPDALSVAMPMVREFLEKIEVVGCIDCVIFGEYFIVADAPDVRSKDYRHLMSVPS